MLAAAIDADPRPYRVSGLPLRAEGPMSLPGTSASWSWSWTTVLRMHLQPPSPGELCPFRNT
jgi:hypothetical protein